MQSDSESPFEILEPPPGGVERMRARLAAPEPVRRGLAIAAAGVAALAVLGALLVLVSNQERGRDSVDNAMLALPELDSLLGREPQPVPLTVERDGQPVQTEQLPSSDPNVRIYRVF
jgi:hypothetical protein